MNALVGLETAAQLAGLSVRQFRRLIQEHPIRVIQIGRRLFFVKSDLSAWNPGRNMPMQASIRQEELTHSVALDTSS
jgi:excisionase family DNA binding protein